MHSIHSPVKSVGKKLTQMNVITEERVVLLVYELHSTNSSVSLDSPGDFSFKLLLFICFSHLTVVFFFLSCFFLRTRFYTGILNLSLQISTDSEILSTSFAQF